jgi:nucleotide-binding universal stress UspA family protein
VLAIGAPLTVAESFSAFSVGPGTAFEELNEHAAHERAVAGAERAREAGFEAEARAEVAAPTWQGIVDVADALDAGVIVIGSRGLGGLGELLKGSVSQQVAEHAHRPVLIVPPARDQPDAHGA